VAVADGEEVKDEREVGLAVRVDETEGSEEDTELGAAVEMLLREGEVDAVIPFMVDGEAEAGSLLLSVLEGAADSLVDMLAVGTEEDELVMVTSTVVQLVT